MCGPGRIAFKTKLSDIYEDRVGIFNIRFPFGKVRAVQEITKTVFRDLL